MSVVIPIGTNNAAGAGAKSCVASGASLACNGGLGTTVVIDDVMLTGITFGATTFDGTAGEIIPGLASIFITGGGGTNVNAEWGDADDSADGDDNPFSKSGFPIPPNNQESTNVDIIDATLRTVFRDLNLSEGIDGEDQNFRIRLDFERGVNDNDPTGIDNVPELIVFERGLNSDVALTLLLADGGESNELFVSRADFLDTDIALNTLEIGGSQALGVVGVDLNEFSGPGFDPASDTVIGVRFGSAGGGADIFGVFGTSQIPIELMDFGDAPAGYATLMAQDGARHVISNDLFIGRTPDYDLDGEPDPVASAATDEDPFDSLILPINGTFGPGDSWPIEVPVTNLTGGPALLCGWIDFDEDGNLSNVDGGVGLSDAERACTSVPTGLISTGDVPDTVTLQFVLPQDTVNPSIGQFIGRLRITTDWASPADAVTSGLASDGEIEDHPISSVSTLPVSIASFESHQVDQGVELHWTTVAETRNAGFYVWGDRGNGVELLTPKAIPAKAGDAVSVRHYRHLIEGAELAGFRDLAVSAVDYQGKEELYGLFEPGRVYGRHGASEPIDWARHALEARSRIKQRGAAMSRLQSNSGQAQQISAADVEPASPGVVEVTYSELAAAGLDLAGVAVKRVAVSLKGKPVAREVIGAQSVGGEAVFGPGAAIRFWADTPGLPDALYVDALRYRIEDSEARARPATSQVGVWSGFGDSFESVASSAPAEDSALFWQRVDDDVAYHFSTPLDDPWYAALLRADRDNAHATGFELDSAALTDRPGRLKVVLGGLTDYPVAPDHHAVVEVNGTRVGETRFDGQSPEMLDLDVPAGVLQAGTNTVTVRAPGGTAAPFDLFVVDRVELGHERRLQATADRLLIEDRGAGADIEAAGFTPGALVAYARDGSGGLHALGVDRPGGGRIEVDALDVPADYWLATPGALVRAATIQPLPAADPLAGVKADLLVIAHPAFLPLSAGEAHPLNDYVAAREAEGWNVALFDIGEIQRHYGYGMALPEAVTRFLAAADARMAYEHVLLVGGDSYDYLDHLGLGSISFIPTRYAPTRFIPHTPADALLADLDGDGVSDKALGRWPVRSLDDLRSIVTKTLDWKGMQGRRDAVWVTDSEDPRQSSFQAQAGRMLEPLLAAQWPQQGLARIDFDQVTPAPGLTVAETARQQLFARLQAGTALTGFVGHGSPTMWTFQGLLSPDDLADLDNVGRPTLISTMTCYTSYFVSPRNDTVAHRWMNGYGEDAFGQPVSGRANGAVAIHGAATLSNYDQNERVAREVLNQQLDGATLGQAIERARDRAALLGLDDQVINWTLLGDPTLKLGGN